MLSIAALPAQASTLPRALTLTLLTSALVPSLRATDYWVDGKRGSDTATAGKSLASPWKTIQYALRHVPVPTGNNGHTLHIVGGQTYSTASNGESFPLRPLYNVTIQGYANSNAAWPVIAIPNGGTGFHFDPLVNYERNAVTFRYLKFSGGAVALDMGGTPGKRHRPRIWQCEFRNQSVSSARIRTQTNAEEDPRFALCLFEDSQNAISGYGNGNTVKFQPDIDECVFRRIRGFAFYVRDNTAGQSPIGGLVQNCQFFDVTTGVYLESGRSATNTLTRVTRSTFKDCGKAIYVRLNQTTYDPTLTVDNCSFRNCQSGIYFDGRAGAGPFIYTIENNRFELGARSTLAAIDYRVDDGLKITFNLRHNYILGAPGKRGVGINYQPRSFARQLTMISEGDHIEGCATAMSIQQRSSAPVFVIRNAILSGNGTAFSAGPYNYGNISLLHATIADNDYGISGGRVGLVSNVLFDKNTTRNTNLRYSSRFEYCCFGQGNSHSGPGNLTGDAGVLRPFYKLAPDSRCIDAGRVAASSPATDYEGDPRAAIGKPFGSPIPDIGADEYRLGGSTHAFGISGYGNRGVLPQISGSSSVKIGTAFDVHLRGAIDIFQTRCDLALLNLASSESLGLDLGAFGAPLSLLFGNSVQLLGGVKPSASGTGTVRIPLPNDSQLVGSTAVLQWLVHAPWLNALTFVTSDGLRMTIGR